jgi:hypothetical protein
MSRYCGACQQAVHWACEGRGCACPCDPDAAFEAASAALDDADVPPLDEEETPP